ncbi:unnamed protein product [Cyclocybe aegerita]|uniref:Uncharacterized protein n=1 Tax=Cyclocybe aegerita TaxID=1973307 RepID=A0A8S0XKC4_CYCAE|nr:unnamed protein product [Cyclocybe aegerita]
MSYASVAAANAPPKNQQPHPDPALLNTAVPTHSRVADDAAKLNVVSPDFKQNPQTSTSEVDRIDARSPSPERKAQRRVEKAEAKGGDTWDTVKHYLIRPGVAGGLMGIVNIGIFGAMGRAFYVQPGLRRDAAAISIAIAVSVGLLSIEGFAAEQYRQTPRGQEEERRAKQEGALIFKHAREQILRPGVLGGIVGLVNTAILGVVGYASYVNWGKTWDRRTVSAISIGLLTLWGGEGLVAERLRSRK